MYTLKDIVLSHNGFVCKYTVSSCRVLICYVLVQQQPLLTQALAIPRRLASWSAHFSRAGLGTNNDTGLPTLNRPLTRICEAGVAQDQLIALTVR